MNCVENFLQDDLRDNDDIALIFFKSFQNSIQSKNILTFSEFYQSVIKAQKYLEKLEIKKGEAILLFEKPTADFYAVLIATLSLGMEAVLVEPWLPLSMIDKVIREIKPKAFLSNWVGKLWGLRSASIRNIPNWISSKNIHSQNCLQTDKPIIISVAPQDNAIISFTTGSSGAPKGVYRSHYLLYESGKTIKKYLPAKKNHSFDLVVFPNLVLENFEMRKGSIILDHKWGKSTLRGLDKIDALYPITSFVGNPAILLNIYKICELKNLSDVYIGGALGDCELYEKAFKKWPKTNFQHVYGSSEAEPVAVSDLKMAVTLSRKAGFYQNVVLGKAISEIKTTIRENVLWVSGTHVSPLYRGDEKANLDNKFIDESGQLWHNMGDLVAQDSDENLWYQGRSFQTAEQFNLEQKIYQLTGSSASFIFMYQNELSLVGENLQKFEVEIKNKFPEIKRIFRSKIYRDRRHQSRLNRDKTLKGLK